MSDSSQELRTTMPGWLKWLVIVMCIAVVAAILVQLLPKSAFPSDLGRVGQGQPALVMLREVHIVGGDQVIDLMREIYPEYEDEFEFLVTQTGNPDGQSLANEYNLRDGFLVLFDAEGNMIDIMARPGTSSELRNFVERAR